MSTNRNWKKVDPRTIQELPELQPRGCVSTQALPYSAHVKYWVCVIWWIILGVYSVKDTRLDKAH